uniref:VWFA domain-containing protein n=1 Tax=Ciona savignyi TaxID=51511 RepID=H2Y6Z1_CIOSA
MVIATDTYICLKTALPTCKLLLCPAACPKVDIVFLLDGSGSILPFEFVIIKDWVERITLSFDISANSSVAVGVMQFSDPHLTRTEFEIGTHTTKEGFFGCDEKRHT